MDNKDKDTPKLHDYFFCLEGRELMRTPPPHLHADICM